MSGQRMLAGRYRLDTVIGQGGMGTVWRGYDLRLERPVAIKELRLGAGLSDAEAAQAAAMAVSEAHRSAQLIHPHIVTTFDIVDEEGKPWLVMQLVQGRSLAQLIAEQGRLPVSQVARIGVEVLSAITAAHAVSVIHRDVKPANILIADADGAALLSDFSIAKALREGGTGRTTGTMVGSPGFVAPELLLTGHVGPEGDLFGLGACLFEAVEGYGAFAREQPIAGLFASASSPHPPLQHAEDLAPVIDALLIKDPAQRIRASEALEALTAISSGHGAASSETPPVVPDTIIRPRRPTAPSQPRPVAAMSAETASGIHDQPTQRPNRQPTAKTIDDSGITRSGSARPPWWRRVPLLVSAVLAVAIGGAATVVLANSTRHRPVIPVAAASPSPSSNRASAPATQASTPTTPTSVGCGFHLAFLGPVSGSLARDGLGMLHGATLAVDEFNQSHGKDCVMLDEYDSRSNTGNARIQANRITADPRVLGVIGPAFSPETEASGPALNAAGIPLVTPAATFTDLSTRGWRVFHRAIGKDSDVPPAATAYIRQVLDATRVFVVSDNSPYGMALAQGVQAGLSGSVVGADTVAAEGKQTDFTTTVTQILASNATVVVYGGYPRNAGLLRHQLDAAGWRGVLVGGDAIMDPQYLKAAGAAAAGTVVIAPDPPISATKESFVNDYRDAFHTAPGNFSDVTFDIATMYLQGIAAGHGTSPSSMLQWINDYDADGLTQHYRFTANGDLDPAYSTIWAYRVDNGAFVSTGAVSQH